MALSGDDASQFLTGFRIFFEIHGGITNINSAPSQDYFGFYTKPEDGVPSIFVNREILSKKAQLFTFVHEFAHFILDCEGISNPFRAINGIEKTCNSFAAQFLAPTRGFAKEAEAVSRVARRDTFEFVRHVSRRTLLSQHAAAIRLVEAGYLQQDQLASWVRSRNTYSRAEKDEEQSEQQSKGGQPHARRVSEIGYLPIYLASKAIEKKYIDRIDVASSLGLSLALQDKAFSLVQRRFKAAA